MRERISRRSLLRQGAAIAGGLAIGDLAAATRAVSAMESAARPGEGAAARFRACVEGARIRWIVGWTPGGGFDTYSRLAEPFIERTLDVQIAIDNVPGAGGLVGALAISRARPDGRTLGILNGSGFLWNRSPDTRMTPDLARDFTVLARVSRRQQMLAAAGASGVRTIDDVVALGRRRPVVAGVTSPDSSNFASVAVVTDLLGVPTEYLAGYPGSREVMLALQRGDCDITSLDIETFLQVPDLDRIRPLLQITPEQSPDERIAAVPHLTGPGGVMARQPELFGGDPVRARALADAINAYLDFGRLFAGPPGMEPALRDCLEEGILAALGQPDFARAAQRAGRSVDVRSGADMRRDLPAVMERVRPIEPVTAAAARRIR